MFSRQDLELVIQKKKLDEVYNWFYEHFVRCTHKEYMSRGPLVILQGSTGSGKSTTLRWISHELGIPLREFTETTDLTSINTELASDLTSNSDNLEFISVAKRKAQKFELFVKNHIRFKPVLTPIEESNYNTTDKNDRGSMIKHSGGVIIHIETPLSFTSTQQLTIHLLCRLIRIVKQLATQTRRRCAIVFETIEGDNNSTLMLSGKMKSDFGFQIFKFNPITKANMKKLIDNYLENSNPTSNWEMDKKTVDQLVEDSNGDMAACHKTLELLCNNDQNGTNKPFPGSFSSSSNFSTIDSAQYTSSSSVFRDGSSTARNPCPPKKRQKINHGMKKKVILDASLMRDTTQSANYFHILGKILYQKRYYPAMESTKHDELTYLMGHKPLERPFERDNDTQTLLTIMDVQPDHLLTWLHQHYPRFCSINNIGRADSFLENLSDTDLLSLNSAQTTQFYEQHQMIDQIQAFLAIESTIFSLYQNKMLEMKNSYKKVNLPNGQQRILKPSVETNQALGDSNGAESLYSFTKPVSYEIQNLSKNYAKMVAIIQEKSDCKILDTTKLVVEYLPYIKIIGRNKQRVTPAMNAKYYDNQCKTSYLDDFTSLDDYLLESFEVLDDLNNLTDFFQAGLSLDKVEKKIEKVTNLIKKLDFDPDH